MNLDVNWLDPLPCFLAQNLLLQNLHVKQPNSSYSTNFPTILWITNLYKVESNAICSFICVEDQKKDPH